MKTHCILLAFFILSCGEPAKKPVSAGAEITDSMPVDGTLTDTTDSPLVEKDSQKQDKEYKGLYIFGNEISTFRDCRSNKLYWVEDEKQILQNSYLKIKDFISYPYESVYAEVTGTLKGKSTVGYASEYDNVLEVSAVKLVNQKNYKTDCFNYEFIGMGNEPFWLLEIIEDENIIAFKDVGSEKTYVFPYKSGSLKGNSYTYQSESDLKQKISVQITKQICSDGMSDRSYSYAATVNVNGKQFKGCAIKKGEKISSNQ